MNFVREYSDKLPKETIDEVIQEACEERLNLNNIDKFEGVSKGPN